MTHPRTAIVNTISDMLDQSNAFANVHRQRERSVWRDDDVDADGDPSARLTAVVFDGDEQVEPVNGYWKRMMAVHVIIYAHGDDLSSRLNQMAKTVESAIWNDRSLGGLVVDTSLFRVHRKTEPEDSYRQATLQLVFKAEYFTSYEEPEDHPPAEEFSVGLCEGFNG